MRELKLTRIEGKIYLFPTPVVKERKYLIFCSSEAEAKEVQELVSAQKIIHPDLVSPQFVFLTFHTDKQTKIFVYKAVP